MEVDKRKVLFWLLIISGMVAVIFALSYTSLLQPSSGDSKLPWQSNVTDDRCFLKPNPGPCEASLERYYFDHETLACKSFTYGGCEGMVPFNNLQACLKECEGIIVGG